MTETDQSRNRQKTNLPLIVSVESRKGGVGKTTAALCLGRLLQQQGRAVLMMDIDVTGTNAADFERSPFWREYIHVIREGSGRGAKPEAAHPHAIS